MNNIDRALHELNHLDTSANKNQWMNERHPLVKFVITVTYILLVVSFNKYDLTGLAAMIVYPLAAFTLAELSVKECFYRLRYILPLLCIVGIFNPFFDRSMVIFLGLSVRGGIISMITLLLKGIFTIMAVYLLIASTTIEKICYALRLLHVPKVLVNQVMLTYRYAFMLLREVHRLTDSYRLRAPGQKGIHFKVWGSMVGMLLLRSFDRSMVIYDSMTLRGYNGDFNYINKRIHLTKTDVIYFLFWMIVLILFRYFPVILIAGQVCSIIR